MTYVTLVAELRHHNGRMTIRRGPYSIKASHHLYTASAFEEWKRLALDGKVVGAVIGAVDQDMRPLFGTAGILENKPREAHWVASALATELMMQSLSPE